MEKLIICMTQCIQCCWFYVEFSEVIFLVNCNMHLPSEYQTLYGTADYYYYL